MDASAKRQKIGRFLAAESQSYDGGDIERARRLGGVAWMANIVIGLSLLPLAPPTAELGSAGWLLAAALLAGAVFGVWLQRRPGSALGWDSLMALSYLALAEIVVLQWAAGGGDAPYRSLFLLAALHFGAIHPPRRVLTFLGAVALAAAIPFAVQGWDALAIANTLALLLLTATLAVLAAVLMTGVRRQRLEMLERGEQAEQLARIDALTELGNRRAFDEALAAGMARWEEHGEPLALIVGDLDHFKDLNDSYGHLAGDDCLRQVARVIRETVRRPDACFRWGGDEFAVIMVAADDVDAARTSERVCRAVFSRCTRPDGEKLRLTCAHAVTTEGLDSAGLVASADMALLSAKERDRSLGL